MCYLAIRRVGVTELPQEHVGVVVQVDDDLGELGEGPVLRQHLEMIMMMVTMVMMMMMMVMMMMMMKTIILARAAPASG